MMTLGDFNAKVKKFNENIGGLFEFGLGQRNERDNRFCLQHGLAITNTLFQRIREIGEHGFRNEPKDLFHKIKLLTRESKPQIWAVMKGKLKPILKKYWTHGKLLRRPIQGIAMK